MPSPVRQKYHGRQHSHLIGWLFIYEAGTPGVEIGDNRPFSSIWTMPHSRTDSSSSNLTMGVRSKSTRTDMLRAVPTLSLRSPRAAPVTIYTTSSMPIDATVFANTSFIVCGNKGLTGRAQGRAIRIAARSIDGLFRSTIFPGLWLDPAALVRGDAATVMAVVQQGVSSLEHAEFAARLQAFPSSK